MWMNRGRNPLTVLCFSIVEILRRASLRFRHQHVSYGENWWSFSFLCHLYTNVLTRTCWLLYSLVHSIDISNSRLKLESFSKFCSLGIKEKEYALLFLWSLPQVLEVAYMGNCFTFGDVIPTFVGFTVNSNKVMHRVSQRQTGPWVWSLFGWIFYWELDSLPCVKAYLKLINTPWISSCHSRNSARTLESGEG